LPAAVIKTVDHFLALSTCNCLRRGSLSASVVKPKVLQVSLKSLYHSEAFSSPVNFLHSLRIAAVLARGLGMAAVIALVVGTDTLATFLMSLTLYSLSQLKLVISLFSLSLSLLVSGEGEREKERGSSKFSTIYICKMYNL